MRVIVVGGGIVGASAAYHLADRTQGEVDVVLADRSDAGYATAAGAGIVCPWLSSATQDAEIYRILLAGARYYPELAARLADDGEPDIGYAPVGGLAVSTDEADLAATQRRIEGCRAEAPEVGDVSRLAPEDVRRLFPPLRADLAGVHLTGGGRVDGRVIQGALRRAAIRRGVRSVEGSVELALIGERLIGVRLDGTTLEADAVVVAAGAWSTELCRPAGIELPVTPQRGQICHLELGDTDTAAWPTVQPPTSHYLLTFPGGRVVVGATRETGSGFDHRVTAGGLHEVLGKALDAAPGLAGATLLETRIGFRPASTDGRPVLGAVQSVDGLVVATGCGPYGLTAGPYAGLLAARLARGEQPAFDIASYRPDR